MGRSRECGAPRLRKMRALRILRAEPLVGSVRFCFVYRGKERMVEMITQVNNAINGVVWGPFGLALLFCTGFWMSARTGFPRRARLFQFFRRTVVRDRKTIPYSVLVRKTFCISYAAFSSVMPTDEFCFGITFILPHHSAAINLFYFSFGSAPSNPRALPSGLASPFSFAVS